MSPSSAQVTYRPEGAGHRMRTACVDLSRIPDPKSWLTDRLGPLANCEVHHSPLVGTNTPNLSDAARLDAAASRLGDSLQAALVMRRTGLAALIARLEAVAPSGVNASYAPSPLNTPPENSKRSKAHVL